MDVNKFFSELDKLFAENKISQVGEYMDKALSEANEEKDAGAMLTIYNEQIGFYRTTGEHEKALYYCEQAEKLSCSMGIQETIPYATTLLNIATENRAAGRTGQAFGYYDKVLEIYKKNLQPDDMLFASYYNNLALACQEIQDYGRAVDNLRKALDIAKSHPDAGVEIATTYANLGESLIRAGEIDEAVANLQEAIKLFETMEEFGTHYSAALSGMAEACYRKGDYDSSVSYFEKAAQEIYNIYGECESYKIIIGNLQAVKKARTNKTERNML
jgi:tetratricopeptide (TPR) repeat protein